MIISTLLSSLALADVVAAELDIIEESEFSGDVSLTNDETREIENLFLERGRGRGSRKSAEKKKRRQMTKKAKHVLKMLKFAEPERKSKEWLEYGCHCFSDIKTDILTTGFGRSVDKIDSACRALVDCLTCSTTDHGESKKCNPYVGYSYEAETDEETGKNGIQCTDSISSCKRSMCECDSQFLKTIQRYNYEAKYSKNKFDRIAECPNKNGSGGISGNKGFDPRSGTGEPVKVCCGPQGLRHPITVTMTRDCCKTRTYNPFVQDCCSDGKVEAVGTC